jgi:hypothetical protein
MDADSSMPWQIERLRIRQRYLPDGRRISFKGLNDVKKQQALIPFLEATDGCFRLHFERDADRVAMSSDIAPGERN